MKHTFVIVVRRFPGTIEVLRDCISDKNISVYRMICCVITTVLNPSGFE